MTFQLLFAQKSSSRDKSSNKVIGKPDLSVGQIGSNDIPTFGVLTDHQAELEKVSLTFFNLFFLWNKNHL